MSTPHEQLLLEQMRNECFTGDTECDHGCADTILTDALTALGYTELVALYDSIKKWYA